MMECEQGNGVSVYQHGISVAHRYSELWKFVTTGTSDLAWDRLKPGDLDVLMDLTSRAIKPSKVAQYQIYHDCGKPWCRTVDADGRVHFPNHAAISAQIWKTLYPDDVVGYDIIRLDMHPHTARGEELEAFMQLDLAPTMILIGIAAVYANADVLFGGTSSDSFKMKLKHLMRLARRFK